MLASNSNLLHNYDIAIPTRKPVKHMASSNEPLTRLTVNILPLTKEQLGKMTIRKGINATDAVYRAFFVIDQIDDLLPKGGEITIIDADGKSHTLVVV